MKPTNIELQIHLNKEVIRYYKGYLHEKVLERLYKKQQNGKAGD